MDSMLSACGMGGPAIAAMALGIGLAILLWLVLIVLGIVSIVWLIRSLRSTPQPPGSALGPARS